MSKNNGHDHARPSLLGAVDLAAMRASREQMNAAVEQALKGAGLVCPCGERITESPVELVSLVTGTLPTAHGPQPGVGLAGQVFHSAECQLLAEALAAEPEPGQPQPIALRAALPLGWL